MAGDLGAIAGDVGFLPTASFCGRIRGDWLNLTALPRGSRLGRDLPAPGGVRYDLEPERLAEALAIRVGESLRIEMLAPPRETLLLPVAAIISRSKLVRCSSRCASSSFPSATSSSSRWTSSNLIASVACFIVGPGVT